MKNEWTKEIMTGHHAYLISGNYEEALPELILFLEKNWKVKTKGNPDFIVHYYPTLYIEDFHSFEKETLTKPLENSKRIFIISFGFMVREAVNAMLKLFEEPIAGVVFFVITPNPERLPDTLRSRFLEVRTPLCVRDSARREAGEFLKMNLGQRFEYSKKLANDISDKRRTRPEALAIMGALEGILVEKYQRNAKTALSFGEFERCRFYMKDQSASVKMLFDSAAMTAEEFITNDL